MQTLTSNQTRFARRPWSRSFADEDFIVSETTLLDELMREESALAERLRGLLADTDADAGFEYAADTRLRRSLDCRTIPGALSSAAGSPERIAVRADDRVV